MIEVTVNGIRRHGLELLWAIPLVVAVFILTFGIWVIGLFTVIGWALA